MKKKLFRCLILICVIHLIFSCVRQEKVKKVDKALYPEVDPWSIWFEGTRWGKLENIWRAIKEYERDNNLDKLYSEYGSDFVLSFLVEEKYIISPILKQMEPDDNPFDDSDPRIDYIYLNPKPDTNITPGTIVVIEGRFYAGLKDIWAITDSGCLVKIENPTKKPDELLGHDVLSDFGFGMELTITYEYPRQELLKSGDAILINDKHIKQYYR